MTDDIVARLRDIEGGYGFRAICREAADEIERLRAELVSTTNKLTAERDELQKWKDAHNTFWRDRAERRDAIVHSLDNATNRHPQRKQEDTTNDEHR